MELAAFLHVFTEPVARENGLKEVEEQFWAKFLLPRARTLPDMFIVFAI